jgi:uncharacterized membrane protein (UPF0127 family)
MPFISEQKFLLVRYWIIFLIAAFISYILPVTTMACPLELPTTTVSIKGHNLIVELAFTPKSRSCGLSNRSELNENHGMLFVYPNSNSRTFWMKDTYIPLSIAFVDDSGKIINIQKMEPNQTDKRYHSYQPVIYTLEVNQGWFNLHGIKAGDIVEIELPIVLNIQ